MNKILWIAAVVALLAAVPLEPSDWIPTLACLIVGGAAGDGRHFATLPRPTRRGILLPARGSAAGRMPAAIAAPNETIVGGLSQLLDQLREAASDGGWKVDWTKFNGFMDRGQAAVLRRDFTGALREYVQAVRFMMSQLRSQGRNPDGGLPG